MDQSTNRDKDIIVDIESSMPKNDVVFVNDANNYQLAVVSDQSLLGGVEESLFKGRKKPESIMEWCEVATKTLLYRC